MARVFKATEHTLVAYISKGIASRHYSWIEFATRREEDVQYDIREYSTIDLSIYEPGIELRYPLTAPSPLRA